MSDNLDLLFNEFLKHKRFQKKLDKVLNSKISEVFNKLTEFQSKNISPTNPETLGINVVVDSANEKLPISLNTNQFLNTNNLQNLIKQNDGTNIPVIDDTLRLPKGGGGSLTPEQLLLLRSVNSSYFTQSVVANKVYLNLQLAWLATLLTNGNLHSAPTDSDSNFPLDVYRGTDTLIHGNIETPSDRILTGEVEYLNFVEGESKLGIDKTNFLTDDNLTPNTDETNKKLVYKDSDGILAVNVAGGTSGAVWPKVSSLRNSTRTATTLHEPAGNPTRSAIKMTFAKTVVWASINEMDPTANVSSLATARAWLRQVKADKHYYRDLRAKVNLYKDTGTGNEPVANDFQMNDVNITTSGELTILSRSAHTYSGSTFTFGNQVSLTTKLLINNDNTNANFDVFVIFDTDSSIANDYNGASVELQLELYPPPGTIDSLKSTQIKELLYKDINGILAINDSQAGTPLTTDNLGDEPTTAYVPNINFLRTSDKHIISTITGLTDYGNNRDDTYKLGIQNKVGLSEKEYVIKIPPTTSSLKLSDTRLITLPNVSTLKLVMKRTLLYQALKEIAPTFTGNDFSSFAQFLLRNKGSQTNQHFLPIRIKFALIKPDLTQGNFVYEMETDRVETDGSGNLFFTGLTGDAFGTGAVPAVKSLFGVVRIFNQPDSANADFDMTLTIGTGNIDAGFVNGKGHFVMIIAELPKGSTPVLNKKSKRNSFLRDRHLKIDNVPKYKQAKKKSKNKSKSTNQKVKDFFHKLFKF